MAADPGRFLKVLALTRAYLSIYEEPHESMLDLLSRVGQVTGGSAKPSA